MAPCTPLAASMAASPYFSFHALPSFGSMSSDMTLPVSMVLTSSCLDTPSAVAIISKVPGKRSAIWWTSSIESFPLEAIWEIARNTPDI